MKQKAQNTLGDICTNLLVIILTLSGLTSASGQCCGTWHQESYPGLQYGP